jgi:hypothetical protein
MQEDEEAMLKGIVEAGIVSDSLLSCNARSRELKIRI